MRILIIGELSNHALAAAKIAIKKGAKVRSTPSIEEALDVLRTGGGELILIDVDLNIEHLIQALKAERIHIPVIACGIEADPEKAAEAIRCGAVDYLPLPPHAEMIATVLEALSRETSGVPVKDPAMQAVMKIAEKVAPSDASVLITGESGTGKEVMARFIHQRSKRAQNPFICLNCAAIPEALLESELFGHEKGAFTGAVARRIGKFEEASGGTLLLDEITEMHPRLQAKLLRAIQERTIDRLGGSQPIRVDIRIIATSNRNMLTAVRDNTFREDLYFRLNVVNLELPPLRMRKNDIETLAHHFVTKYSELNQLPTRSLSLDALTCLKDYRWPGNVRELENTMHRAVLLSADEITPDDLNLPAESADMPRSMAEAEKGHIQNVIQYCLGNRERAASILGISIRALREKLDEYDMMAAT